MSASQELIHAARRKLAESAINSDRAHDMGLRIISGNEIKTRLHPSLESRGGILIPYFDIHGSLREDVYRVRYLESPSSGFQPKRPPKYGQPTGSSVAAYLAPSALMRSSKLPDWKIISENPRTEIYITEGEFKAACAVIHGLPTIGLGGVYSFQSQRRGISFLPELEEFTWDKRTVYVIYDSDVIVKPEVQQALAALCEKLTERGAIPRIVHLPSNAYGAKKVGLDDFIVEHGVKKLHALIEQSGEFEASRVLHELNQRFAVWQSNLTVLDFTPRADGGKFNYVPFQVMQSGSYLPTKLPGQRKSFIPATRAWLTWPYRREIDGLDYLPGVGERIVDGLYNTWNGWGLEPKPDPRALRVVMKLFEHLIPQIDRRTWFLAWLAWPLRFPGTKLYSASALWGKPGTGKSLVGYLMKDIYGDNFIEISSEHLGDRFNEWALGRQFAMVDEASTTQISIRETSSELKRLITQERIIVNQKYKAQFVLPDVINYYFTSNHPHCLQLDSGDRRYFVHEVTNDPLSRAFYEELDALRKSKAGPAALFHYLLYDADVSGFNPREHAFGTEDKGSMIELSATTDSAVFVREMMADPSFESSFGPLFSIADLQRLFEQRYPSVRADNVHLFSRALAGAGAARRSVFVKELKKQVTLFALYDLKRWSRVDRNEIWARTYATSLKRAGKLQQPANF